MMPRHEPKIHLLGYLRSSVPLTSCFCALGDHRQHDKKSTLKNQVFAYDEQTKKTQKQLLYGSSIPIRFSRSLSGAAQKNLIRTPQNGPYVITVDIVKGGTGKTTTAAEITMHLQLAGLRVLAIDLDVQANLTQYMGYEADLTSKELESYGLNSDALVGMTFAHVICPYLGRSMSESFGTLIKMPFGPNGPHLIPADTNLGDMEYALSTSKGPREMALIRLLNEAKAGNIPGFDTSNYDVIVFDCPPNVSMTSTVALAAADLVVAPVRLDSFGVKGLARVIDELRLLKNAYGDAIRSELVILATHFAPQLARIQRMHQALQQYEKQLAPISISLSEDFPKSLEQYIPLSLQKPLCQASSEYKSFTDHLIKRLIAIEEKRAKQ